MTIIKRKIVTSATSLLLLAISLTWFACDSGRGQNRILKEAAEIHTETMARYDSVYAALEAEKADVEAKIARTASTDERMKAYDSMIRSIDKSMRLLNGWDEAVIGVPGLKETDTTHHHHDHQDHAKLSELSDKEILELQKAYRTRLNDVITQVNGLLTTIKMYENDA